MVTQNYAEWAKLYPNPATLKTIEGVINDHKNDPKIDEWENMVVRAKGFISSFYKGDLEAKIIYVLSKMFFSGEYTDDALERLGNCNVASVLSEVYSHPELKEYIVVPIYLIAKGEAKYTDIAKSLGIILKNPKFVSEMVNEIMDKFK